jgi:hypothetical protein
VFVAANPRGVRGVTSIRQVRRLAKKALEFLELDVGVKLFITLLKGNFISTFARAACRNGAGLGLKLDFKRRRTSQFCTFSVSESVGPSMRTVSAEVLVEKSSTFRAASLSENI